MLYDLPAPAIGKTLRLSAHPPASQVELSPAGLADHPGGGVYGSKPQTKTIDMSGSGQSLRPAREFSYL